MQFILGERASSLAGYEALLEAVPAGVAPVFVYRAHISYAAVLAESGHHRRVY